MRTPLQVLIIFFLLSLPSAIADDTKAASEPSIMLYRATQLDFAPQRGYLFLEDEKGQMERREAVLVSSRSDDPQGREGAGEWIVGTRLSESPSHLISVSAVLWGEKDQVLFLAPQPYQPDGIGEKFNSVSTLREELLRRKEVLQSWRVQADAQDTTLQRLRSDAELIGDVGKIVEVKEYADQAAADTVALDRDIEALKGALVQVRSLPPPKNMTNRESQLTTQIADLARVLSATKPRAPLAEGQAANTLEEKLAIIEATRSDNIDELQQRYDALSAEIKEGAASSGENALDHEDGEARSYGRAGE